MGFERGWGDTAARVLEMMHLLLDILQAPDPSTLETFLGRVPMVFNVVILSPHGYFGQANVLGLPDTGGQVCINTPFQPCRRLRCFLFYILAACRTHVYATWSFPLLRQLVPNVLPDCIYPGPSSCSREGNAS